MNIVMDTDILQEDNNIEGTVFGNFYKKDHNKLFKKKLTGEIWIAALRFQLFSGLYSSQSLSRSYFSIMESVHLSWKSSNVLFCSKI